MTPDHIQKIRRVEQTLRAAGTPMAKHLADDLAEVLIGEMGSEGLAAEELAAIKAGRPIDAIKMVLERKKAINYSFGLKKAKDFVEQAAQRLGFFNPNVPAGSPRWKYGF